ncbi:FAD-binding oxidoreductase [soil metagenome]
MKGASVAVVGGGVIGASVAYHLAAAGMRDVVVLDRGIAPGSGSTARATGGFRAQFHTAVNVRLSLLSRSKLLSFRDDTGVDPGYVCAGYLWVASSEPELEALRAARAVQHAEGLTEAVELAPDEVSGVNDAISLEDAVGATFCPSDGFIQPMEILRGYVSAAESLGARMEWDAEVVAMERDAHGRIVRIGTKRETMDVECVVNAAGAWAARIAALAGVVLPVAPLRRQVAVSERCDPLPALMPMTIFTGDGFHLRCRDGRAVLCWPTPGNAEDPFDTSVDGEWLREVSSKARARVPVLRDVQFPLEHAYAGLYEMSPDSHAILGGARECANMFLACGSSGHGVMHAPALGQLLAEIIAGKTPALDVGPLRPSRFAEGQPNPDSWLL